MISTASVTKAIVNASCILNTSQECICKIEPNLFMRPLYRDFCTSQIIIFISESVGAIFLSIRISEVDDAMHRLLNTYRQTEALCAFSIVRVVF